MKRAALIILVVSLGWAQAAGGASVPSGGVMEARLLPADIAAPARGAEQASRARLFFPMGPPAGPEQRQSRWYPAPGGRLKVPRGDVQSPELELELERRHLKPGGVETFLEVPEGGVGLKEVSSGTAQVFSAFLTNFFVHEMGHVVVGDHVGAEGMKLKFLTTRNGKFFLGSNTVGEIDPDSMLPYVMGGAWATDYTFEYALQSYRTDPNVYNRSLLLFSGMEFLWYSLYSFYLSEGHGHYDPVSVSRETGISKDIIFLAALVKTAINAYRVHSGNDTVIPHFTVDRHSAVLNLRVNF